MCALVRAFVCMCVCTFWCPSLSAAIPRLWAVVREGLRSACTHTLRCQMYASAGSQKETPPVRNCSYISPKPDQTRIRDSALSTVRQMAGGWRSVGRLLLTPHIRIFLAYVLLHSWVQTLTYTFHFFLTPHSDNHSRPALKKRRRCCSQVEVITCY